MGIQILLLISELIGLSVLAYYDFKHFEIPKNIAIGIFLVVIIIFGFQLTLNKGYTFELMILGAIFWYIIGFAKGLIFQNPYRNYKEFDKVALLISAITLPLLFLISIIIQQLIIIAITGIKQKQVKLPIMTLYCCSFVLATMAIGFTIGLNIPYL